MSHQTTSHDGTARNDRGVEDVSDVEIAIATILPPIIRVHVAWAGDVAAEILIADAMRPGVVREQRNAMAQPLLYRKQHSIVGGIRAVIKDIYVTEILSLTRVPLRQDLPLVDV